jgi:excisionase family DNA binding protein
MTTSHSDELLTTAEAAKYLRVHERTIRSFVRDGMLQQIRLGHRTVRFRRDDLHNFLMRHSETGTNTEEANNGNAS